MEIALRAGSEVLPAAFRLQADHAPGRRDRAERLRARAIVVQSYFPAYPNPRKHNMGMSEDLGAVAYADGVVTP